MHNALARFGRSAFLFVALCGFVAISMATDLSTRSHQDSESTVPSWNVDTVHSCAMFRVRHMGAGLFWGRFNDVGGTIDFDPADSKSLAMDITIDVDSVDSGHPGLDKHLKSPDFFDTKEFPMITFKSAKAVPVTAPTITFGATHEETPEMAWNVTGTFSMHGVSKDVTARVLYWGANDMGRGLAAGFEATFVIKRSEFGVNYGVEQGALGDLVTVTASFEVGAAK